MNESTAETEYAAPMGPRFTQIYSPRRTSTEDSDRMRKRIAAFFKNEMLNYTSAAWQAIETRIGTDHPFYGYAQSVAEYLRTCSAADFRDAVTVIHWGILKQFESDRYTSTQHAARRWREFCRDAFIEENVSYRVDDACVVRPFVDEAFAQTTAAVLRGLEDRRLSAVRSEVDDAMTKLGGRQPDPKGAVRAVFEALEIYTKLVVITCTVRRLNRNMVTEHLVPMIQSQSSPDEPAKESVAHLGNAVVDWVEAAHVYRHGQGVNEPAPPSPELAVALVSTGLGHLRWLLDTTSLPAQ